MATKYYVFQNKVYRATSVQFTYCTISPENEDNSSRVYRTDEGASFRMPKALAPTKQFINKHRRLRLRQYTADALSAFFKKPIKLVGFNYGAQQVTSRKLYAASKLLVRKHRIFKKLRDCHLLMCTLFASLKFKDTQLVSPLIKSLFEGVHYSKHRMIYYFWRAVVHNILPKFFILYNLGGVKLEFHGKLGVGGNSKKRSYYFKRGLGSNSTKFLKIDATSAQFRTATGVVGFTYSVFY